MKAISLSLLVCGLILALAGCGKHSNNADASAQNYGVRGIVRGFSPDRQTIEIQHENIPDFMPSMTMPFLSRSVKATADLHVGDAIAFQMTVTRTDFWIDKIQKIRREDVTLPESHAASPPPAEAAAARLHEGDDMPVFSLKDQTGKATSLESFRGRPLLLTFIFTRCAVPTFCPRMSNNFNEVERAIKSGAGSLNETRLLSITLDPGFDTPEVLKGYANHLQFDPAVWTFATGENKEIDALTEAFSIYRKTEGGTLSHGLATALVGRNGQIIKIWRGNNWTPAEVIAEIKQIP